MCFTRFRETRGCFTTGMVLSSLVKINRRVPSRPFKQATYLVSNQRVQPRMARGSVGE
jgi:hypothetical protein